MEDKSIHISNNIIYKDRVTDNKEILSTIEDGLETLPDEHELAEEANKNIRKNMEGKENVMWPNKNNTQTTIMANGLDALDEMSKPLKPSDLGRPTN